MNRRAFLKGTGALAATAMAGFHLPIAHAANARRRLCVFIQADGGWDPTSRSSRHTNISSHGSGSRCLKVAAGRRQGSRCRSIWLPGRFAAALDWTGVGFLHHAGNVLPRHTNISSYKAMAGVSRFVAKDARS